MSSIAYYKQGRRDQNKVTLTFEDGPTPGITEQVLGILKTYGVIATFFVVGKWVSEPESAATLRRLVENGHVVGNHSMQHLYPPDLSDYPITEFADAEAIISKVVGAPTRYARAPYFIYQPHACEALASWVGDRKVIHGLVSGYDWEYYQNPERHKEIVSNVLESTELGPGAIIILHDGSELAEERFVRPLAMIKALPTIIEGVRARGLEFVSIDDLAFDEADLVIENC